MFDVPSISPPATTSISLSDKLRISFVIDDLLAELTIYLSIPPNLQRTARSLTTETRDDTRRAGQHESGALDLKPTGA